MSGLISRRPLVGFTAGIIFGILGMLLIGIDASGRSLSGVLPWLFKIVGFFLLFMALGSVITAAQAVWEAFKERSRQ